MPTTARIKAWVRLCPAEARQEAAAADARRKAGAAYGPLDGVPYGMKDIVDTAGLETTSSSKVLVGNVPATDATVVRRLRAAGAVLLGKVNTHPFAYGVVTPPTRNPWNTNHVPGGSSGGSGAAVAADQAPFTIGTDTGGSIRIPACLCGITGLKPTFGRVPKDGVAVLSYSLDHVGPMCWSAEDAALVLNAIAGPSPRDPNSAKTAVEDYARDLHTPIKGLRIGVAGGYFTSHFPGVNDAIAKVAQALAGLGGEVREIAPPLVRDIPPHHPGFAIHLADATSWHVVRLRRQGGDYPPDVASFLKQGELMLATDYINAQRYRSLYNTAMRELYDRERLDALVLPTVPVTAGAIGQAEYRATDGFVEDLVFASIRCTFPFNMTGQPALTVPCGFDENRLPFGLQIVGRPWQEALVLRIGHQYQQVTDWHQRRPTI